MSEIVAKSQFSFGSFSAIDWSFYEGVRKISSQIGQYMLYGILKVMKRLFGQFDSADQMLGYENNTHSTTHVSP